MFPLMHFCELTGGQLGCLVVNWCFSVLLASLRVVRGQNFLLHPDRSLVSVRDLFRSILEIRCVSVESEAGFWFVDPSLSDLVFLRLRSLNRSFYGYDFQFHRAFLPSSVFPRRSDLFESGQGGRSAATPADGLPQADSPVRGRRTVRYCFIGVADRSWRTVYAEPFQRVPGAF